MKNKNEVTGNLLLGCTVLRITPETTAKFLAKIKRAAADLIGTAMRNRRLLYSCSSFLATQ